MNAMDSTRGALAADEGMTERRLGREEGREEGVRSR